MAISFMVSDSMVSDSGINVKKNQRQEKVVGIRLFSVFLLSMVCNNVYADRPAALSAQTIKSPSGPASLKGLGESFSPNMSTGTGEFSVPIEVVPGIVKPSVTLTYTGGHGKSELGMSFRLPVLMSLLRIVLAGSGCRPASSRATSTRPTGPGTGWRWEV